MSNALKAVHACRRQVRGLEEEETWRTFLQNLIGKRSLREMSEKELGTVIDELRRCGAAPKHASASTPHVRKVYAVWEDMCRLCIPRNATKDGLRGFVHRMAGVDDPNWMDVTQAQHVIEALKAWRSRELKKREESA